MKKTLLIILVVCVVLVVIPIMSFAGTYNSLITKSENIDAQWANVESKLQRRFDLIPNLVNSVKGIMEHEDDIFIKIAEARANMTEAKTIGEKVNASSEVERTLSRLLVVMENYPELKSSENVSRLMDELAGTENRISVERDRYNDMVKEYNTKLKRFPTNIIGSMMGFETKEYFKAQEGSEQAPIVDLSK